MTTIARTIVSQVLQFARTTPAERGARVSCLGQTASYER
jgi:hypothetical protein